jgi:hypothetical protein
MLKCDGIRNYNQLSKQIMQFVDEIKTEAPRAHLDMTKLFSFTYQDVMQLIKCISYISKEMWEEESVKLKQSSDSSDKKYNMEHKSKAELMKEIENEENDAEIENRMKIKVEKRATIKALEVYAK